MKTEELIRALAADGSRPVVSIDRALLHALALGAMASITLFLALLHPRADLAKAILTVPFVFKLTFALLVAAAAAVFLNETARPMPPHRWRWLLALAPLLLLTGVLVELLTAPESVWAARLIGHNARHCVSLIPMLSVPLLICLFVALRHSAPTSPILAGATAGLVASGVGSLLYALTCPDDSPLFVATWYSIAIAIVTCAGAYLGRRLLRW